jgi:guanylate kinase
MTNNKTTTSGVAETSGKSKQPGHLFIISAPSGAGKTTLRHAILHQFSDLLYSVSFTTRHPRQGEKGGTDYHFISKAEFEAGIHNERWAEWAAVHGNYYGTSAEFLKQNLTAGKDVLADIDVQGTRKILHRFPESITIFLMPPSLDVLKERLQSRGTDTAETIALRLKNAKVEMAQRKIYRHVIINDQLDDAIAELASIIGRYKTTC